MVVGCEHKECEVYKEYDEELGAYYYYYDCLIYGYYWEGPIY